MPMMSLLRSVLSGLMVVLFVALTTIAGAGPILSESMPAPTPPPEGLTPLGSKFEVEAGYVGSGDVSGSDLNNGSVESIDTLVRYTYGHRIGRALTLGVGVEWQRFSFGFENSAGLLPNTLQSVGALFSVELFFSEQWITFAAIRPGLYSDFDDISTDDFNMSGVWIAAYRQTPDLTWFGGLTFDLNRDFPVVPVLGVRWKFADDWMVELAAPRSRIQYDFAPGWRVFGVAGYKGDAYRVGETFGSDSVWPILNNAWLTYREVRVGAGVGYKWNDTIDARLEAGAAVYREFNYNRVGVRLTADPAPFVSGAVSVRF